MRAVVLTSPGSPLDEIEVAAPVAPPGGSVIDVLACGICHSDLSMIDNQWGNSVFPLVTGHEAVGIVETVSEFAKGVKVGDRVGLGWFAGSCMSCHPCLSGRQNLCANSEQTIFGRHGGFADRVRDAVAAAG